MSEIVLSHGEMAHAPIDKKIGFLNAFVAASLMGFVGFFARHINAQGDFIAFSRMLFGAAFFIGLIVYRGRLGELRRYALSFSVMASGFFMGNSLSAYVAATQHTSIANAVFFIYIGPIISTLLAVIFLKERMKFSTWLAVVSVFTGMLFIVGLISVDASGVHFSMTFSEETLFGDMLALYSGVGYGLFLFFGRLRTEIPGDIRAFWNFVFALIGIVVLFTFTTPSLAQMGCSDWLWWIAIGFVCGFGALGTCTIAIRHLKAVEFACVSYWECVVAALFVGLVLYDEPLSTMQFVGGGLIVLGGMAEILVSLTGRKVKPAQQPL
ncbi:DMT family transporter [Aeromonas jandaei]